MKVVTCIQPGSLQLEDRPLPQRQQEEVLVRIRRVGVCGTDMHIFCGDQPYLSYPRVMGHELAGEVAEAPADSSLRHGDHVYVIPYIACGRCIACRNAKPNCCADIGVLGVHRDGGLAEYLAVPEAYVRKADGISLDQAAMIEFLAIGAHAVRRAKVTEGHKVLVVGAGPIGIGVALFSRLAGGAVTILDSRDDRLDFCRGHLGVEAGLPVTDTIADELAGRTSGDFFDIVFDATGSPKAMEAGFGYVAHGGTYVLVSIVSANISFSDPEFHKREMTLMGSRNATAEDFETVHDAIRRGLVPTAALHTHSGKLDELPETFPQWLDPSSGVIKALVSC